MSYWTTFKRSFGSPNKPGNWQPVEGLDLQVIWGRLPLLIKNALAIPGEMDFRVLRVALPFYPNHFLYEIVSLEVTPAVPWYIVDGPDGTDLLDWTNEPIYSISRASGFMLDESTVIDYLRFFFSFTVGRHGRFILLESPEVQKKSGFSDEHAELFQQYAQPLLPEAVKKDKGVFQLEAVMLFQDTLAKTSIRVTSSGQIDLDLKEFVSEALPVADDVPTDSDYPGKPVLDLVEGWRPGEELASDFRESLAEHEDLAWSLAGGAISWQALPFFRGVVLLRIATGEASSAFFAYALQSANGMFSLNGESTPIHEALEREDFTLNNDTAIDYLHFFCSYVHGEEGPFRPVTRPDELNTLRPPSGSHEASDLHACPIAYDRLSSGLLHTLIGPTTVCFDDDAGDWYCSALNQYGGELYRNTFTVKSSGEIEMNEDEMLVKDIPYDPERNRVRTYIQVGPAEADEPKILQRPGGTKPPETGQASQKWPRYINERGLEASILGEYVRLQLLAALRGGQGGPLIDINQAADDESLLKGFAEFVYTAWPVMILESPIPYIEDIVSWHLTQRAGIRTRVRKATTSQQDSARCLVPTIEDGETLLISLHQWQKIIRPEAVAYQLGVTDALTLIGCDTEAVVPSALHRVVDIQLSLGAINPELFRSLFCRLFDCNWPQAQTSDDLWQHYVTPGDFYAPVRDMLRRRYIEPDKKDEQAEPAWTGEAALAAIEARVRQRLTAIEVDDGPGLDELHGLGEAKAILKDLLSDIRAVVAGELSWDAVDRGMLLVGEPGTGKTLLARALARDGGVRFLHASEARWIAGTDGLSEHILAIRASFAEARRNAPCILFIDELDSIGNRQLFEGRNKEYCTEIVNTLLQELQGAIDRQGVFVIGATNYLKYVDPALTRAGRLDQVVQVPRPDRHALAGILQYYLAPFARDRRLADDIDSKLLAGMALGATGADIEFFVRDAARRARKEDVHIGHRHLAAAITHAPRNQRSTRPVSAEEQARTAVHEAGHAIALLLCQQYPARLSMVSIIPRNNGSLGFTGSLPERGSLTRQACQEYLQVLLAGRAAEALIYGNDELSSGAGGSSDSSDLAVATRWASRMICQLGFGPGDGLRWREQPTTEENLEQIRHLLNQADHEITAKLNRQKPLINELRDALLEKHELYAPALYQRAAAHGIDSPASGPASAGGHRVDTP